MRKIFTLIMAALLTTGAAMAETFTDSRTYTVIRSTGSTANQYNTFPLQGAEFTVSPQTYYSFGSKSGLMLGSGGKPAVNGTVSTKVFAGKKIKSVNVNASCQSSFVGTMQILVGSKESEAFTLTTDTVGYEFKDIDVVADSIVIKYVTTSNAGGCYFKRITVEFEENSDDVKTVATPTFYPTKGLANKGDTIKISAEDGAYVYYTTTNSTTATLADPNASLTSTSQYTKPLVYTTIANYRNRRYKAIAIKGLYQSAVAEDTINVISAPVLSRFDRSAVVSGDQVSISSTDEGVDFYYTTDGTAPTVESTKYTAPIAITNDSTTITVIATNGETTSDATTATYVFKTAVDKETSKDYELVKTGSKIEEGKYVIASVNEHYAAGKVNSSKRFDGIVSGASTFEIYGDTLYQAAADTLVSVFTFKSVGDTLWQIWQEGDSLPLKINTTNNFQVATAEEVEQGLANDSITIGTYKDVENVARICVPAYAFRNIAFYYPTSATVLPYFWAYSVNNTTHTARNEVRLYKYVEKKTPTAVTEVNAAKEVAKKVYYNVAGVQSAEPFQGVNIVKTVYTDGTSSVEKTLK